jgi:hypothetical protein
MSPLHFHLGRHHETAPATPTPPLAPSKPVLPTLLTNAGAASTGFSPDASPTSSPNACANRRHLILSRLSKTQPDTDLSSIRQGKLFAALNTLAARCSAPLSKDDLVQHLPASAILSLDEERSNDYVNFYTSTPFGLPDSYSVRQLEARADAETGALKMMVFSLDDAAVGSKALQEKYGSLSNHLPSEGGPDTFYHTSKQPWGELRFGYQSSRPDMLKTVTLDLTAN